LWGIETTSGFDTVCDLLISPSDISNIRNRKRMLHCGGPESCEESAALAFGVIEFRWRLQIIATRGGREPDL
jgi:hypothetical protein